MMRLSANIYFFRFVKHIAEYKLNKNNEFSELRIQGFLNIYIRTEI